MKRTQTDRKNMTLLLTPEAKKLLAELAASWGMTPSEWMEATIRREAKMATLWR